MLTVKLLQTTQKIEILGSESQVYKKWQTAAMIREIFNSNMETGRNGPESGVSQIVRESWQHLHCRGKLGRVGKATGLEEVSLRASSPIRLKYLKIANIWEFNIRHFWAKQINRKWIFLQSLAVVSSRCLGYSSLSGQRHHLTRPNRRACSHAKDKLFFF